MAGTKATKKANGNGRGAWAPEGFRPVDLRPKQIELETGLEIFGTLGPVVKSKNPQMPDFRSIQTDSGLFYLPSHAALSGLLAFQNGQQVALRFNGGNGKKGDPYDWSIALPEGSVTEDGAPIPF